MSRKWCSREKKQDPRDVLLIGPTDAVEAFTESVGSLWCPLTIPILDSNHNNDESNGLPNPLLFARHYVQKSRPCIIRNAGGTVGSRLPQWTVTDIQNICGNHLDITVNVTPNGHGDAIHTTQHPHFNRVFVLPEERRMKLGQFVDSMRHASPTSCQECDLENILKAGQDKSYVSQKISSSQTIRSTSTSTDGVYYYSMQNDCLRSEFRPLIPHVESAAKSLLEWAQEAFGTGPPDAVNLWMGNDHAHSSLHKDHYENLFYVSSGEKVFTLYPPANAACLTVRSFPTHRFSVDSDSTTNCTTNNNTTSTTMKTMKSLTDHNNDNKNTNCWHMVPELDDDGIQIQTPWIDLPASPASHLHPLTVVVRAGDVLYLPSLWFHAVTQTCETVGINWWFDMDWNSPLWCYFQLLENCRLEYVNGDTNEHK